MAFGDGKAFNPAIPGAIGGTTPAPGTFTTLGATGLLSLSALVVTRATADQAFASNITLANLTNMSHAIAASEEWVAEFSMMLTMDEQNAGIKFAVTVPAGATLQAMVSFVPANYTALSSYNKQTTTGGGTMTYQPGTVGTGTAVKAYVSVWVLNSTTAGTVQLQAAQNASSVNATTILKGSFMRANRIA